MKGNRELPMKKRRCVKCGAVLTDEDVMKIKIEDGSWQTIPFTLCSDCFTKQMRERTFN
jgi:NAD-dependent SIR2 family protein deacetylase